MPTYDYECPDGHTFEIFQRISDEPVASCPECGADAKRLISGGAGFLFKGEGFYITDYRSEDYKKKASAEPGSSQPAAADSTSDGGAANVADSGSSASAASSEGGGGSKAAEGTKSTSKASAPKKSDS